MFVGDHVVIRKREIGRFLRSDPFANADLDKIFIVIACDDCASGRRIVIKDMDGVRYSPRFYTTRFRRVRL